jgi:hypothetical protein
MAFRPDDKLYRRIHTEAYNWADQRITSAAFKTAGEYDQSISVYVAKLLGHEPGRVIEERPQHGVAVLTAGAVEAPGFTVVEDPDPTDAKLGHAHVLLVGLNNRAISKRLAQAARLVIMPKPLPA